MARRRLAWLLSIPLMLGGTEAAHWLAFRVVYPNPWERAQALQASGHGYLGYWPSVAGIGLALVVVAVMLAVREHARPGASSSGLQPARLLFAALPPLAFALQEHVESLVHSGTISGVAEAPTFVVGLALQLPFALAAYVLARLLLEVAALVGRSLRTRTSPRAQRAPLRFPGADLPALTALAAIGSSPGRGPPSLR